MLKAPFINLIHQHKENHTERSDAYLRSGIWRPLQTLADRRNQLKTSQGHGVIIHAPLNKTAAHKRSHAQPSNSPPPKVSLGGNALGRKSHSGQYEETHLELVEALKKARYIVEEVSLIVVFQPLQSGTQKAPLRQLGSLKHRTRDSSH